jgi:DNA-binding protein HU-beta
VLTAFQNTFYSYANLFQLSFANKNRFVVLAEKGAPKVNKNDLVTVVASAAGLSKADAAKAVDGVFAAITDALKSAKSEGRNPRTGQKITIPASKQPKFKAGKGLKDAVN